MALTGDNNTGVHSGGNITITTGGHRSYAPHSAGYRPENREWWDFEGKAGNGC